MTWSSRSRRTLPTQSLRDAVLPRTSEGGSDGQDPVILHCRHDISLELRVTVENQELLRLVISPGLTQLQRNPICAGILGHVEMEDLAPVVIDHEETVQNAERQCGHGEEVHRRDGSTMIAQKDQPPPSWIRILGRTLDPARYRSL